MDERAPEIDEELVRVTGEEEACLARVASHLAVRNKQPIARPTADYDAQMLELRDQIAAARLEDVPPLLEQMERLHSLASRRREQTEVQVDTRSPYFGHLVLEEGIKRREVLIGRGTHLDTQSGVRIVDWRDAPVSRLFYRYEEGDDYDEVFGDREVSGKVVTRRSVTIADGSLRRISAPQGSFSRSSAGKWRRLDSGSAALAGGAGTATRAAHHHRPGKLGIGQEGGEDKHLKEITPLIDRRQFELITRPNSGLVVIQGGAGSGKTTIGLHRLAYLAYQDARRFRADKLLVVVFNDALARYIGEVLPALGVNGVAIRTYEGWAHKLRQSLLPKLPSRYREDTPSVVTRLKKHPSMLRVIDAHVAELAAEIERELERILGSDAGHDAVLGAFRETAGRPLSHRLHKLRAFCEPASLVKLTTDARFGLDQLVQRELRRARDVTTQWADLLSDGAALSSKLEQFAAGAFSPGELERIHVWCNARISEVLTELEQKAEQRAEQRQRNSEQPSKRADDELEAGDDGNSREWRRGVDGQDLDDAAQLDIEDDTLLLRLYQRLRGPLTRGAANKEALVYEHILVDEAQDLSPIELAVVLDTVSKAQSITLSGDTQQRLLLDNGFSDWKTVLSELGLSHVEIEPLKLSYRSTAEIIEFARHVLGPLAHDDAPVAIRVGAPVELFDFGHAGDAIAFLSEALRGLMQSEPAASVAVVTRYPEQADVYFEGLRRAEVPFLRRIAEQDFPFKPGIDVTDVRQVKGLEFDYVIAVEVSDAAYPAEDEARHLLHIAATRAAHQLWVLTTGRPSPLLPPSLRDA
ncbi:MAG TPA: UvrD-helicase domain-containing protein [Polyangiaceae bacterium]|jgi:DNA helicase-2/ATP-dependent DNA helicase PcrA